MDLGEWIGIIIVIDGPVMAGLYYLWRKWNEKA
jgi:hypothetical protein